MLDENIEKSTSKESNEKIEKPEEKIENNEVSMVDTVENSEHKDEEVIENDDGGEKAESNKDVVAEKAVSEDPEISEPLKTTDKTEAESDKERIAEKAVSEDPEISEPIETTEEAEAESNKDVVAEKAVSEDPEISEPIETTEEAEAESNKDALDEKAVSEDPEISEPLKTTEEAKVESDKEVIAEKAVPKGPEVSEPLKTTEEAEAESDKEVIAKKAVLKDPEVSEPVETTEESEAESDKDKIAEKAVPEDPEVSEAVETIEEASEVSNIEEKKKSDQPVEGEAIEQAVNNVEEKDTTTKKIPTVDVSNLSLDDLAEAMMKLEEFSFHEIKKQFEVLKSDFTKKYNNFIGEKKAEFIKDGGNEIDFKFYSPVKTRFNELVQSYKRRRQKYYKEIESEQKDNLRKKLQLIDDLKNLIDNADPSSMYKEFRSLQEEWRKIGQIPHAKYNDVWRTYHHHIERFYDLLHLNNDLRDLDFKHNLEEKTKLVEKVEELAAQDNINHAFKELQILHRMWKEDIGPVARDAREDIWDRFSEATKKIHDKRHEYQNQLDSKYRANVDLKIAVIEKIKNFKIDNESSHKSWQEGIKQMEKLRNDFFTIGKVPRSKNEEIWQLFKDATRTFNKSKNNFYKSLKKIQLDNLSNKMKLVEQAESLKESEDWDTATEVFKKIQADWRKIGHVPRKDSDKIWKKFKDACNHYFDKLHHMQDGSNKDQVDVFNKKKEFLNAFKDEIENNKSLNLDLINARINEWKHLGAVPAKMRHIDSKFNKAIDAACKKIDIDKDEASLMKFKIIVDGLLEQNNVRKIDGEQLFVKRKVDDLTKEIKLLENNISFISNASKDNPLVANVYKNIEKYNEELRIWKKKLAYLRQLDY